MLPQRKNVRLQHFDYHANGYYFITICCLDKRPLLGTLHQGEIQVSLDGQHLLEEMFSLERTLRGISVYDYVIMPNHFHLVVEIQRKEGETGMGGVRIRTIAEGECDKKVGKIPVAAGLLRTCGLSGRKSAGNRTIYEKQSQTVGIASQRRQRYIVVNTFDN